MENFYLLQEKKEIIEQIRKNENIIKEAIDIINSSDSKKIILKEVKFKYFRDLEENEEFFKLIDLLSEAKERIKKLAWRLEEVDEKIEEYNRLRFIENTYEQKILELEYFLASEKSKKYQYGVFYKLSELFSNWEKELEDIEGVDFLIKKEKMYLGTVLGKKIREVLNFSNKEAFDLNQYLLILLGFRSNGSMYRIVEFDEEEYLEEVIKEYDQEEIVCMIKAHKTGNYNIKINVVGRIIDVVCQ